jgi:hypothetical protein
MTNLPAVYNTHPKVFVFLGVQMKILLSSADTGGQFLLVEGTMRPAAMEACIFTFAKMNRCIFWKDRSR